MASLTREHTFIAIFNSYNPQTLPKGHALSLLFEALGYGFSQGALLFVDAVSFFAGSQFIFKGSLTMESLFRVLFAAMFSVNAISMLSQYASNFSKGIVASTAIYQLLNRQTHIDGTSD